MRRLGKVTWPAVSVLLVFAGMSHAVGCSNDAEDGDENWTAALGACDAGDDACKWPVCSGLGDGAVIDGTPVAECHRWVCREGPSGMEPKDELAPSGTSCKDGVCDMGGACVSCHDGLQNGDESGVDCGGSMCKACLGASCSSDVDCTSVHCGGGVCCKDACQGICDDVGDCKSPPGALCSSPSDCLSYICDNGICS